jgi:hypothetical protein
MNITLLIGVVMAAGCAAQQPGQFVPTQPISSPSSGTTTIRNWRSRLASDPALTPSERLQLFFHNDFESPRAYLRTIGAALGGELVNGPKEWGRGPEGFGRRVEVDFVMFTSRDLIRTGTSAMFGHDPRYQKCECTGGLRRTGHALSGVFMLADSHGVRRFDPSNVIASYTAGYIGSTMYPPRYTPEYKGTQLGHWQLGHVMLENVLLEFGPDIKRMWRHTILRRDGPGDRESTLISRPDGPQP